MSGTLLDGKACANAILADLQKKIHQLDPALPMPQLAIIQVGIDPASSTYVRHKLVTGQKLGFHVSHWQLSATVSQTELSHTIQQLNLDPTIHGILLQLPLPPSLCAEHHLAEIHPQKDVDGLHPTNLGYLVQHRSQLLPCTPKGILRLLDYYHLASVGLHAVIINNSTLVGRPLALLLLDLGATVTVCHSRTRDLSTLVAQADMVISATGITHFIQTAWLKPGCIAIDVGVHRQPDGKLKGEFDFASAKSIAAYITPVPGGVGPVTVAQLMENLWQAYTNQGLNA